AVCFDGDHRALAGREQQDSEDALAVDFFVAFTDLDVRLESRGRVNELRRRACVQAELVLDLDVLCDQRPTPDPAPATVVRRSDATRMAFEPFSVIMCATV